MQLFGGIGTSEILFILVLMVIVLGPKKMVAGARELGKTIHKVTRSQFWKDVQKTSREIHEIPRKIMDEVEIEEDLKDIKRTLDENFEPLLDRSHAPDFKNQTPESNDNKKPT